MTEQRRVLTATDKATKGLTKATTELTKVAELLATLSESTETLGVEVDTKQAELEALTTRVDEDLRKSAAELNIRILENEDNVLNGLLEKNSLARMSIAEAESLVKDVTELKADNTAEINDALKALEKDLLAEKDAELTSLEAAQSVETATLKAQIESLTSKISYLEQTNIGLKDMLNEERKARVEVAKAARPNVVQPATPTT